MMHTFVVVSPPDCFTEKSACSLSATMPHTPVSTTVPQTLSRSYTTPRKLQYDGSIAGLGAEENARNGVSRTSTTHRRTLASRTELPNGPVQQLNSSLQRNQSSDSGSDCSVAKLKGWLDDFGQQNRNHTDKTNKVGQIPNGVALQKPIRAKVDVASSDFKPVKRTMEMMKESRKGPTMTPVRFKTRFDDKIKATDHGYASVKQLSAWLADDPTTVKNSRGCVRRGINVINKSRKFEKDLEDVIIEEVGLERGDVHDKKEWLQKAFEGDGGSDFDRRSAVTELVSVQDKKKWLTGTFGDARRMSSSVIDGGRDSRSVVSVNDKREWLQSAFQKGSDRIMNAKDNATPAKEKWRRRRSSKLLLSGSKRSPMRSDPIPNTIEAARLPSAIRGVTRAAPSAMHKALVPIGSDESQARVSSPPTKSVLLSSGQDRSSIQKPVSVPLGEDESSSTKATAPLPTRPTTSFEASNDQNRQYQPSAPSASPVDFKAARMLLVQRSKVNGNPVKVMTKVQMRKNKFEKWEKGLTKGVGPKGLLKPTWEQEDGNRRSSTQYAKAFVEDIAPKKSFEHLP
jgi:hypothetical protein